MKKITHVVFDHDGTLVDTTRFEPRVFTGIMDMLQFLKTSKIKMYVWTARSNQSTTNILTQVGLIDYFTGICGSDNAPSKPSSAGIEFLIPEVDPKNVIVIGDSLGDIIGGVKFGAHCIGASWAHGDASADIIYRENGARTSFVKVEECCSYIKDLL